jgi:hypothetical protein
MNANVTLPLLYCKKYVKLPLHQQGLIDGNDNNINGTSSQTAGSTEEKESDAHLSDATQLIKYLDHKRGEVSYVALYYEVKSTPLHTSKKADLRRGTRT